MPIPELAPAACPVTRREKTGIAVGAVAGLGLRAGLPCWRISFRTMKREATNRAGLTPFHEASVAGLLVDLAQFPLQFRDQLIDALLGLGIRRLSRQVPIFHDLHFEFYSLVF